MAICTIGAMVLGGALMEDGNYVASAAASVIALVLMYGVVILYLMQPLPELTELVDEQAESEALVEAEEARSRAE